MNSVPHMKSFIDDNFIKEIQDRNNENYENSKKITDKITVFKNVKSIFEDLDNKIVKKNTNSNINLDLIRFIETNICKENLSKNQENGNSISINLEFIENNILKIKVNDCESFKIKQGQNQNLIYNLDTNKLFTPESNYNTFGHDYKNVKGSLEKSTTIEEPKVGDSIRILNSLRTNNISKIGLPPETPNFSESIKKEKNPADSSKNFLFTKNFENEINTHFKDTFFKHDSEIENNVKNLIWEFSKFDNENYESENLEKLYQITEFSSIDQLKIELKLACENIYKILFEKILKIIPFSANVLHNLIKKLILAMEFLIKEQQFLLEKVTEENIKCNNFEQQNEKLMQEINDLKKTSEFSNKLQQTITKISDVKAEEDLYVVQEVTKDLNKFSDNLSSQHNKLHKKVQSDLDNAISLVKNTVKTDNAEIRQILDNLKNEIYSGLLQAKSCEKPNFQDLISVGLQTENEYDINKKDFNKEMNKFWEFIVKIDSVPYTYPAIYKITTEFMEYYKKQGFIYNGIQNYEIDIYKIIACESEKINIMKIALLHFFTEHSKFPIKEYAGFLKGLRILAEEKNNHHYFLKLFSEIFGISNVSMVKTYIMQNYTAYFYSRIYHDLLLLNNMPNIISQSKFNEKIPLLEFYKFVNSIIKSYLNEITYPLFLHTIYILHMTDESPKKLFINKAIKILIILSIQCENEYERLERTLKKYKKENSHEMSLSDFIKLLNSYKIYLPCENSSGEHESQYNFLINSFKETGEEKFKHEPTPTILIKMIQNYAILLKTAKISILDGAAVFSMFIWKIIEMQQIKFSEILGSGDKGYLDIAVVLKKWEEIRINDKRAKKIEDLIKTDIINECSKKKKIAEILTVKKTLVWEIIANKWLVHSIFLDLFESVAEYNLNNKIL